MNVELSITQIAAKLNVSERTARRRIEDGDLMAKKLDNGKYLVNTDHIEALAPAEHLASIDAHLKEVDRQISTLEATIDKLEARMLRMEDASKPTQPIPQPRHVMYESRIPASASTGEKEPLPEGWASWYNFIMRHGLRAEDSGVKSLDKSAYIQPGTYIQGKATIREAVDHEAQARLIILLSNMRKYHACEIENCVCHTAVY